MPEASYQVIKEQNIYQQKKDFDKSFVNVKHIEESHDNKFFFDILLAFPKFKKSKKSVKSWQSD